GIPVLFDPRMKLPPRLREPVVRTVMDGLRDLDRRPLTRLDPAGRGDRLRDRNPELEVEDAGLHTEVMREHGTGRRDALAAQGRHDFLDRGPEHLRHLLARD